MSTPAGRLKHARKLRDLNQIQLAEKAGVATGTIGNIESGKRGIKSSALVLAKALNVNPDWLATGEGEMEITGSLARVAAGLDAEIKFAPPGGTASVGDASPTVSGTLANLGELLINASPKTRAAVADLLSRYAQDPATGQSLAEAIEVLIKGDQVATKKQNDSAV